MRQGSALADTRNRFLAGSPRAQLQPAPGTGVFESADLQPCSNCTYTTAKFRERD